MSRYRWDVATGQERLIARYRPMHYCRSCLSWLSASSFGASRIRKRDYECRPCHTLRCRRERSQGKRGRRRRS